MLKPGDQVGIVACSNGLLPDERDQISELISVLTGFGLKPVLSPYIFAEHSVFSGTGKQRADALNAFYEDDAIKAIFDVSGGDLANELLDKIDYNQIAHNPKPFFGYSDLTSVIDAIYAKTGVPSYLYQVRCLVWDHKAQQSADFKNSLFSDKDDLFRINWDFVRGSRVEGTLVGGNIRCLLKLAGTQYMPDFKGKVLFLESYSGGAARMTACLNQLRQLNVFDDITGLLLGTFTRMEEKAEKPDMLELVTKITREYDFPIARTEDVGHRTTSKCLIIGKNYSIQA